MKITTRGILTMLAALANLLPLITTAQHESISTSTNILADNWTLLETGLVNGAGKTVARMERHVLPAGNGTRFHRLEHIG